MEINADAVADRRDLGPRPVRKAMTVAGESIIHELRGLDCLSLELMPARRKGCAVARPFYRRIRNARRWSRRTPPMRRVWARSGGTAALAPRTSRASITPASTIGAIRCARSLRR